MTDTALRNRLLATVPERDDADWLDVCRRARAIEAPRRRNRRLLAFAAVLVLLTALVVNPALGIGERLLDYVEGDPAPEAIKEEFARQHAPGDIRIGSRVVDRPERPPLLLPRAHLAVGLRSSVGPAYLWVAPMVTGGWCWVLELPDARQIRANRLNVGGGCFGAPSRKHPISWSGGTTMVNGRPFRHIEGRVHSRIARLEITLSNGRTASLRLVDGFYLAELPPTRVAEYRGLDANGSLVERVRVPSSMPPSRSRPLEPFEEAASIRLYSGREARIEHARGERGTLCWRVIWGPEAGGCNPVQNNALPSMMVSGSGENQLVLLNGPVGSRIASVDLIWDSGDRERLVIQNGFVLKQIDPNGTRWPSRIVGRDEAGRVVAERSAFGSG